MPLCCVSGCRNSSSPGSNIKFYRIPSGVRLFQTTRRRLWVDAISAVNGRAQQLNGNARVCGAHFISGEASMDVDDPDFVPSVFPHAGDKPSPKRKMQCISRQRKKQCCGVNEEKKLETTPPRGSSPVDLQSSLLMEETQQQSSPSMSEEGEALDTQAETEAAEDENTTTKLQIVSSPDQMSIFFKVPEVLPKPHRMSPTVLLKPVFVPEDGYRCEICSQSFPLASQLVKHKQQHEDRQSIGEDRQSVGEPCGQPSTNGADFTAHHHINEPSFPCNVCDRTFTTTQHLKRHKLLHVKDGRKCQQCGVLFCQRHNHILFKPQTEQASSTAESDSESLSDNSQEDEPVTTQISDVDDKPESTMPAPPSSGQISNMQNALPPASDTGALTEIPVLVKIPIQVKILSPVSPKPSPVPVQCKIEPICPQRNHSAGLTLPPRPQCPPELPSSLKIFSPQFLTSALLKVERNYEYILSKARAVETNVIAQSIETRKDARTAYDLEMVL